MPAVAPSARRSPSPLASKSPAPPASLLASLPTNSQRQISSILEKYQRERLAFAQSVAEIAQREGPAGALAEGGAMHLLAPLLTDHVQAVQQAAALAVGRLANHSEEMSVQVVQSGILDGLVASLVDGTRYYKKASSFVLRSVAKHSAELAQAVASSGALGALVTCVEDFDPTVKEGAVWALGYVARHNADLAHQVVSSSSLPLLVLCLQEPSAPLKRIACSTLSDIAKHTPVLSRLVSDSGAVRYLCPLVSHLDIKLRRQALSALAQVAKHTVEMAEHVVDGGGGGENGSAFVGGLMRCLRDDDAGVRRNAATLVCEIVKHSEELSQLMVNSGALAPLVDYISTTFGLPRIPGLMSLGYISAFSSTLSLAVIVSDGPRALADALENETDGIVRSAAAWTLGQVGRHGPDHARAVAEKGIVARLAGIVQNVTGVRNTADEAGRPATPPVADLTAHSDGEHIGMTTTSSSDLATKSHRALKSILSKLVNLSYLDPLLLPSTHRSVLKHVVAQYAKVLPNDVAARKEFVATGGLARLEEIKKKYETEDGAEWKGSKMAEAVRVVEECYPEEIVRYYSPDYSKTLLDRIEEYGRGQQLPSSNPADSTVDAPAASADVPAGPPRSLSKAQVDRVDGTDKNGAKAASEKGEKGGSRVASAMGEKQAEVEQ